MIYNSGENRQYILRKLPKNYSVFMARMADCEGSYRLIITAPDEADARVQAEEWIKKQPDDDSIVSISGYDLEKGVFT